MRTYERPTMLARAITSVQQQTFTDWTLVIVNNGGDPAPVDNVVEIARRAHPGCSIEVIHLAERVGMEEASNTALGVGASEFFAIHDDDDSWRPRFLELTVGEMAHHPGAAAVVTGVTRIHELSRGHLLEPQRAELFMLDTERLTYDVIIGNNMFPPIAALFRRSLLDRIGWFDATLPVLGDWEFNLRALAVGPFVFLPERLANYHTRTPESDQAMGNSITVGRELHAATKRRLWERWDNETTPDGRNKGEVARAAHVRFEERERELAGVGHVDRPSWPRRQARRIASVARSPRAGGRALVRRARALVGA